MSNAEKSFIVLPDDNSSSIGSSLFRQQVFDDLKNKHYGMVSINVPVKYSVLTAGISLFLVLIILFFMFAEYSEKFIVKGYVNSTPGVVRVYPAKQGVLVKSWVHQGMSVGQGDPLFLVDTSYDGLAKTAHHAVFDKLVQQAQAIDNEIKYKKAHLRALKQLLDKKYLSLDMYSQKRDELHALLVSQQTIEMDLIKYKQNRSYLVRAPIEGVVASVIYQVGQNANMSKPLVKIIPAKADLIAELFIPVSQAGFITKHNPIVIRYDAYPSARFGTGSGVITEKSQSILTDEEDDKPIRIGQPYYKVIAKLDTPFVIAYGKKRKVAHGMTFSAVILGSKKKVWQWVLDPLYSYYGELFV